MTKILRSLLEIGRKWLVNKGQLLLTNSKNSAYNKMSTEKEEDMLGGPH